MPEANDVKDRGALFQQLLELSDIVLDGYRSQLESIKHGPGENQRYLEVLRKYEQDRTTLIKPFSECTWLASLLTGTETNELVMKSYKFGLSVIQGMVTYITLHCLVMVIRCCVCVDGIT